MPRTDKRLKTLLLSPQVAIFAVSLVLLALNIAFIGKWRPFNSDDIYWQQVVHTWKPFSGPKLYLATKDIFVEQVPLFALLGHFFEPTRKLIIAEVLLLTLSAFTFFYWSSLYFLKKLKIKASYLTLLPFVWLASFGYPLVQNYLNSDWRTFEVGLCFLTFALVAAILFDDIKPLRSPKSKVLSVLVAALIGIIIYSDPYFIFFAVGPLLLFVAGLYLLKRVSFKQLAIIFGAALLSMVFAKASSVIATKAGVVIVADTPSVFIGFDSILTNIVSSLHGLLIVFGADFFGRQAFKVSTFGPMINAAVLVFILYQIYGLRKVLQKTKINSLSLPQLWTVFFGLLVVFVLVLYTSTTLVTVNNYRFFIVLIYSAMTFLAIVLGTSRSINIKRIVGALLVAAILWNTALTFLTLSVRQQPEVANDVSNNYNYTLIHDVEVQGLTKGYAGYWQGNINTYLSNNKVAFLPSLCDDNGHTVKFKWLIDGSQFNRKATKSFYLIDPDFPAPGVCTKEQLVAQFGEPEKIIKVADKTILVYDYDISSRIRLSLPSY